MSKLLSRCYKEWCQQVTKVYEPNLYYLAYIKNKDKPNDLVFVVGSQGELKGAIQCAKV